MDEIQLKHEAYGNHQAGLADVYECFRQFKKTYNSHTVLTQDLANGYHTCIQGLVSQWGQDSEVNGSVAN